MAARPKTELALAIWESMEMKIRRYCVTVMDNWTPTRLFWTRAGAARWFSRFVSGAYLWQWQSGLGGFWEEITPVESGALGIKTYPDNGSWGHEMPMPKDQIVVLSGPACASCKKMPWTDCDNPACAFRIPPAVGGSHE